MKRHEALSETEKTQVIEAVLDRGEIAKMNLFTGGSNVNLVYFVTFKETLRPAIEYAENGFPVSERIANDWRLPRALPPKPACERRSPRATRQGCADSRAYTPASCRRSSRSSNTSCATSTRRASAMRES